MAIAGWPAVATPRKEIVAKDVGIVGEEGGDRFLRRNYSPCVRPRHG